MSKWGISYYSGVYHVVSLLLRMQGLKYICIEDVYAICIFWLSCSFELCTNEKNSKTQMTILGRPVFHDLREG